MEHAPIEKVEQLFRGMAEACKKHNSPSKCGEFPGPRRSGSSGIESKRRMNWLQRAISVIFATVVAIGAGLVFVPVAVFIDPKTRAAGFALVQYAASALDNNFALGLLGSDFAILTRFVWMVAVMVCAVPVIVVGLIGEVTKMSTFYWYAGATGLAAASTPWLVRASLHLPRAAGYNYAELRFAFVFFLGGLISGLVYWLLAGRDAGVRA
jgi:hypothetical protein